MRLPVPVEATPSGQVTRKFPGSHWSRRFRLAAIVAFGMVSLGAACPDQRVALLGLWGMTSVSVPGIGPYKVVLGGAPNQESGRYFFLTCTELAFGAPCQKVQQNTPEFRIIVEFLRSVGKPVIWPGNPPPGFDAPPPPPAPV